MKILKGLQAAHDCPECGRQGASQFTEEFEYEGVHFTITRYYECGYCGADWKQMITGHLRVTSNSLLDVVTPDDDQPPDDYTDTGNPHRPRYGDDDNPYEVD